MSKVIKIRQFQLRQFRQFSETALSDFERINLLVGANNSGKTAAPQGH